MPSQAPGNNKPYTDIEMQVLIYFKNQGLSWNDIATEYNKRVDLDRERTAAALESKWRQLKHEIFSR